MEAYFWREAELIVLGRDEKPAAPNRLAAKGKAKETDIPKKEPKKKKKA